MISVCMTTGFGHISRPCRSRTSWLSRWAQPWTADAGQVLSATEKRATKRIRVLGCCCHRSRIHGRGGSLIACGTRLFRWALGTGEEQRLQPAPPEIHSGGARLRCARLEKEVAQINLCAQVLSRHPDDRASRSRIRTRVAEELRLCCSHCAPAIRTIRDLLPRMSRRGPRCRCCGPGSESAVAAPTAIGACCCRCV